MHNARHFAAATNGGGVRAPPANSSSKMGKGDVTNFRRWLAIFAAISGKLIQILGNSLQSDNTMIYFRTRIAVDFKAAS